MTIRKNPKRVLYHVVTEWQVSFYTFLTILLGALGLPLFYDKHYWSLGAMVFIVAFYRFYAFGKGSPIKWWEEYGKDE